MVSLDALVPSIQSGVIGFAVGVGVGYIVHWLRVRREDAKEDRDQIIGPLLGDVNSTIQGMEGPWPLRYVPNRLSSIHSLYERGRLNPPRLEGVRKDWQALSKSHERMVDARRGMLETVNRAVRRRLQEVVRNLPRFPHGHYRVDAQSEPLDLLLAKDWVHLAQNYESLKGATGFDISRAVDWKDFWSEHQEEFEALVDEYLRSRREYLEDLKAVQKSLEKWTRNIYRRYKSALVRNSLRARLGKAVRRLIS